MTTAHHGHTIGFILAIVGTALFSVKSIFIKLAYAEGLNSDAVLMMRMAIAFPIYLFILLWLQNNRSQQVSPPKWLLITFLGFIGYYLSSWLDFKGLEYISAQLERLTLFTYPLMVALLGALFFDNPLTRKVIIALIISYAGLWLVFYQELNLSGDNVVLGTLLVALAALSFSFYVLIGKQQIQKHGSVWFTAAAMTISSLFMLVHFIALNDFADLHITARAWLWLALLAIVSTVIPSFMISEAIHKIGPAQTGIIGTLGPIITLGLAVWILNEPFGLWHGIGVLMVIFGVGLLGYRKNN
ncbi:DMT family transporter [Thiomicrorhabdus sediminis]|uniref:DMT family transporter n=1 Tax=Thiomicrorhabdus sediminis TaxID=2580412 RepID=A0A4P9K3T7_9GAMM|nr:DMT family transporter [Thiomicrorhabdus sediminis]QCU89311.1 DMT family transporter [Thiomicrorhabdus sediminis]